MFRHFKKIEGLFFPATEAEPIHLVAINVGRPITRQRFTAAHELCHFLKDSNNGQLLCP
ncbi:MAG: ImmA/IrrE family metallo-endopeptidase [Clostridiales bacterium]|nr:ImmA/IrrE family metallo-endopeptidase [Clostridiales bacterium]